MIEKKVRRFMPGESLNTIFSARQFGLCLAVDVIEALKDFPPPTLGSDAYTVSKWIKKWFPDFMETKEFPTDSIFYDPTDFTCSKCQSSQGMWLHDKVGNGIAIRCRDCGNEVKAHRSWLTELRSRHSKCRVGE